MAWVTNCLALGLMLRVSHDALAHSPTTLEVTGSRSASATFQILISLNRYRLQHSGTYMVCVALQEVQYQRTEGAAPEGPFQEHYTNAIITIITGTFQPPFIDS